MRQSPITAQEIFDAIDALAKSPDGEVYVEPSENFTAVLIDGRVDLVKLAEKLNEVPK